MGFFTLAVDWRSGPTLLQRLLLPRAFLWGEPFGHSGMLANGSCATYFGPTQV
jgi:hypothetical protein